MNILIVEDHEELRKMLVLEVERRGCVAYEAGTLGQAFACLTYRRIDAILCDGEFPSGIFADSLPFCESWIVVAYRAALEGKRFALLSGDPTIVEKARAIGVVGAFSKPDGLKAALEFLLQESGIRSQESVADLSSGAIEAEGDATGEP